MAGTASLVPSWLLLEQPGSWPRTASDSRHLSRELVSRLSRLAGSHSVRVVLLRRPGRADLVRPSTTCFLAHTRRVDPWVSQVQLADVRDVLELDLPGLSRGDEPATGRHTEPVFCVCTHGKHDPCCAERGRPVAAALAVAFPEQTWEVSHIGGDRFAGNVLCLPSGVYLGRVEPGTAVDVVSEVAAGRLPLAQLRGRTCDPPAVQAADAFLRYRLGLREIRAVLPVSRQRVGPDEEVVRFRVTPGDRAGHVAEVRVRTMRAPPVRPLTCTSPSATSPPSYTFELVTVA